MTALIFLFLNQAFAQTCQPNLFSKLKLSAELFATTIIDQQIEKRVPEDTHERDVLKMYPEMAPVGKSEGCKALILAHSICDAYSQGTNQEELVDLTNDEETDALRHFIVTAFIARRAGADKTKFLMNAHEGVHPDSSLSEAFVQLTNAPQGGRRKMDLYNNYVALAWTKIRNQNKKPVSDEEIVETALLLLGQKQLRQLKTGTLSCAKPGFKKSWLQIKNEFDRHFKKLSLEFELCTKSKKIVDIYNFLDSLRPKK